jgi:23S rRNA pseudouridine1911/1915/1917 synthase
MHKTQHETNNYTLVDWLTSHFKEIETVGSIERPGIVHRLDKDSSGLLIIARTNYAHQIFTKLFKDRAIKKTYLALVEGHPEKSGTIDQPIGRHQTHRLRMTTYGASSSVPTRHAITHYKVLEYFDNYSLVEFKPETGRTHQIRVHAAFLGHPLVGDTLYASSSPFIKRHALHASSLSFNFEDKLYEFNADLPHDFATLIAQIKKS